MRDETYNTDAVEGRDDEDDVAEWMTLPPEPPAPPPGTLAYEPVSSKHRLRAVRGRQLATASLVLGSLAPVVVGVAVVLAAREVDSLLAGGMTLALACTTLAALLCARMADRRGGSPRRTRFARIAAVGWLPPLVVAYVVTAERPLIAVRNAVLFVMIAITIFGALLMFLDTVFDGD